MTNAETLSELITRNRSVKRVVSYLESEQNERVVSYAESAYQLVSSDLKHDLASKVPLMLYKTQSEFQQQNVEPGELPEGVLAFAEPYRDRMVLPIDEPDDALYRLITHELTHIFEFDIIPRSLLRRGLPLWVDEGLADYMTSYWNPFDRRTATPPSTGTPSTGSRGTSWPGATTSRTTCSSTSTSSACPPWTSPCPLGTGPRCRA